MLGNKEAVAMIAVRDMPKARAFYEQTLGLAPADVMNDEVVTYRCGPSKLNVYRSAFAGTNQATCALWDVGADIAAIAASLKARGVHFEQYALPGMQMEGDVHVGGGMKVAWFRDVDGNILSLVGV